MSIPKAVLEIIDLYLKQFNHSEIAKQAKKETIEKKWLNGKEHSKLISDSLEYDLTKTRNYIDRDFENYVDRVFKTFEKDITLFLKRNLKQLFEVNKEVKTKNIIPEENARKLDYFNNKNAMKSNNDYQTYALCHHCYSEIPGVPYTILLEGLCYRKEETSNLFRKEQFKMIELVHFNSIEELEILKHKYIYIFSKIGDLLKPYKYKVVLANDSFISNDPGLILYQLLEGRKVELQVYSEYLNEYVSLASINMHGSFFANKFNIKENGNLASSMCVGFGIDRIEALIYELNDGEKHDDSRS